MCVNIGSGPGRWWVAAVLLLVYTADEWVSRTVRRAHDDALDWIEANRQP